jgi:polyhydroxyalkanoate synthase
MESSEPRRILGQDLPAQILAEQQRLWQRMLRLPQVMELACTTRVGTTPHEVVLERRMFKLIRYRRETPATWAEPVLLCYALINRSYILDLLPGKSVAGRYLERGFDVYLIDWAVPGAADRGVGIDDYVSGFVAEAVAFILAQHRRETLHLLGYCMGGTISTLYTALEPAKIQTLTLLAAPIDFAGRESLLQLWADAERFDVDGFIDAHGNCPAWFLQSCFLLMKPIQNFVEKSGALYEQMDNAELLAHYFAMERWINDNVPVAGETFRAFVKRLYQRNELVRGQFQVGGRRIDLGGITCPLLLLTATNDHLVSPLATEGLRPHVGSRDIRSIEIGAGHVGLVVGSKAQRTMWPEATRWLAERSTARPA